MGFHEPSDLTVPCQSSPYSLVLVESDGHSVTGAADRYSEIDLFLLDSLTQSVGVVGIVATRV